MGTITSGVGLISGINTAQLIDQLLQIDARPKTLVQNNIAVLQSQSVAFQDVNAKLLSLKLTTGSFSSAKTFSATTATSSNENVFTASTSASTVPGNYAFTVSRLVSTQQVITNGFKDRASDPVAPSGGTLTFEFGDARLDTDTELSTLNGGAGVTRGKIRITDRSGASAVVDLSKVLTVNDVLDTLNEASGISVTASINSYGITLTDNTGLGSGNLTVADVGSTGTATSLKIAGTSATGVIDGSALNTITRDTLLSDLNDGLGVRTAGTGTADFRIQRANGNTRDITLAGAETVGDVIDLINAAYPSGFSAQINTEGTGIDLVDASPGVGFNLSVTALNSSKAASDLGILGTGATTSRLSGQEVVSTLNSKLLRNLQGGTGVSLGSVDFTNRAGVTSSVNLTGLTSVQQVIDAINDGATGITASLNSSGNGLLITDTTGSTASNLTIAGAAATSLGIAGDVADTKIDSGNLQVRYLSEATRLDSLNGGAGVASGKFIITDSAGVSATVDLSQGNEVTLQDVIAEINSRGIAVNARINDNGDGLIIEDTGPGTSAIKIVESGSTTAADLGILGEAASAGENIDGSFERTVTLEATDTLNDVVDKINSAGYKVKATVINDGSAQNPYRLSLLSTKAGKQGAFVFDDGGLGFGSTVLNEAKDAVLFYGSTDPAKSIAITSTTNTLTTLIPGATINLKGTSSSPVQLVVSRNDDSIVEAVSSFVDDFNSVIDSINKYDKYDSDTQQRGLLLGDSTLATVRSSLYRLVNTRNADLTSRFTALTQVGVKIGSGAKLSFDEAKFREALDADPDAVQSLFTFKETSTDETTGDTTITKAGVGVRIDELLGNLTDSTSGTVQVRLDAIDKQITLGNDRIAKLDDQLAAKKARYQAQFAAMETALAQIQSQSSALTSLSQLAASVGSG
ncbi:MAG: flagellar filament capping protein FliD [Phycisphaera sp.]|nr:flagellar filament capping protein FliD [Phycisphaera sp.]